MTDAVAAAIAAYKASDAEYRKAHRLFLRAEARLGAAESARKLAWSADSAASDKRYFVAKDLLRAYWGPGWVGATIEEAKRILRIESGREAKVIQIHTRRKVNP